MINPDPPAPPFAPALPDPPPPPLPVFASPFVGASRNAVLFPALSPIPPPPNPPAIFDLFASLAKPPPPPPPPIYNKPPEITPKLSQSGAKYVLKLYCVELIVTCAKPLPPTPDLPITPFAPAAPIPPPPPQFAFG
jgi:hypothetical protein